MGEKSKGIAWRARHVVAIAIIVIAVTSRVLAGLASRVQPACTAVLRRDRVIATERCLQDVHRVARDTARVLPVAMIVVDASRDVADGIDQSSCFHQFHRRSRPAGSDAHPFLSLLDCLDGIEEVMLPTRACHSSFRVLA